MNSILILELVVAIIVSFTLLGILIWAIKNGQFEDSKKLMESPLFDTPEDLQRAVEEERRVKELKRKKLNQTKQNNPNSNE